jgi:predicted site-specific integrase-resolvase
MAKQCERPTASSQQVADALGISLMTVTRLCRRGLLESYRVTPAPKSRIRVYVDGVEAFAKKQGREIAIRPD